MSLTKESFSDRINDFLTREPFAAFPLFFSALFFTLSVCSGFMWAFEKDSTCTPRSYYEVVNIVQRGACELFVGRDW